MNQLLMKQNFWWAWAVSELNVLEFFICMCFMNLVYIFYLNILLIHRCLISEDVHEQYYVCRGNGCIQYSFECWLLNKSGWIDKSLLDTRRVDWWFFIEVDTRSYYDINCFDSAFSSFFKFFPHPDVLLINFLLI